MEELRAEAERGPISQEGKQFVWLVGWFYFPYKTDTCYTNDDRRLGGIIKCHWYNVSLLPRGPSGGGGVVLILVKWMNKAIE